MKHVYGQPQEVRHRLQVEVAAAGILHSEVAARDGLPLSVWRTGPVGNPTVPTVVLVHGATFSTLCTYDLPVEGLPRQSCSALLRLASAGYAVIGVDLSGYGSSARRDRPGTLADDVADLTSVLSSVRSRCRGPIVVLGWSWGAQLAALLGTLGLADGIIFYASRWRPLPSRSVKSNPGDWRRPTRLLAMWDFTTPTNYEAAVRDAFVTRVLDVESTVPSTALRYMSGKNPLFSPSEITCPALVVAAADDPSRDDVDRQAMVERLTHPKSREVVLPAADHNAHLDKSRDIFYDCLVGFLSDRTPSGRRGDGSKTGTC